MKNTRPPTNTEALISLKDQGFEVRIQHLRKVKALNVNEDGLYVYKTDPVLHNDSYVRRVIKEAEVDQGVIPYFKYVQNGGATEIELNRGEEKIVVRATCYNKDHFCRRLGVAECLRKLEKLHNIKA